MPGYRLAHDISPIMHTVINADLNVCLVSTARPEESTRPGVLIEAELVFSAQHDFWLPSMGVAV